MISASKLKPALLLLGLTALAFGIGLYMLWFADPVLAKVGELRIHRSEAVYRDQVIRVDFPDEMRSMGLYQLMKSAMNQEILRAHKVFLTDEIMISEEQRIEQNTKDPEKLQKIKTIFGKNHEAYLKVFILPNLANRIIYPDFFLRDTSIQHASLERATQFIAEAGQSSSDFTALAAKYELPVRNLRISLSQGVEWDAPSTAKKTELKSKKSFGEATSINAITASAAAGKAMSDQANEETKKWIELAEGLKPKQVFSAPINHGTDWLAIRYLGKSPSGFYAFEAVLFPKLNYTEWFEQEKKSIKVDVYDKQRPVP